VSMARSSRWGAASGPGSGCVEPREPANRFDSKGSRSYIDGSARRVRRHPRALTRTLLVVADLARGCSPEVRRRDGVGVRSSDRFPSDWEAGSVLGPRLLENGTVIAKSQCGRPHRALGRGRTPDCNSNAVPVCPTGRLAPRQLPGRASGPDRRLSDRRPLLTGGPRSRWRV
jgi:hypothetical protein